MVCTPIHREDAPHYHNDCDGLNSRHNAHDGHMDLDVHVARVDQQTYRPDTDDGHDVHNVHGEHVDKQNSRPDTR